MPALTLFVAKCYGERSLPVFFQMDLGDRWSGVIAACMTKGGRQRDVDVGKPG